tara:strand:+ start:985 stop:1593 length:609 start_codon:yes stop_codon:yes gene_type:complete
MYIKKTLKFKNINKMKNIKNTFRKVYRGLRNKISDKEIHQMSLDIANNCNKMSIWNKKMFHLFLTIPELKEVETSYIISLLQGRGKKIAVPKVCSKTSLKNFLLTDFTIIEQSKIGIFQPKNGIQIDSKKIDVVFVPLLVYDINGNRIGYGKGYYDNFLKSCNNDCLKIGLSFFPPEEKLIPSNKRDIRIDYCVTPSRIYQF